MEAQQNTAETVRERREREFDRIKITGLRKEDRVELTTRLRTLFVETGLPLKNVKKIHIASPGDLVTRFMDGDADYNPNMNTVTIRYELFMKGAPLKEFIAHELAHANSPFDRNDKLFGKKERKEIQEYVKKVADYLYDANLPLSPYHMRLMERRKLHILSPHRITKQSYYEETWAILAELRLTNLEQLKEIEDILATRRKRHPTVPSLLEIDTPIDALRKNS